MRAAAILALMISACARLEADFGEPTSTASPSPTGPTPTPTPVPGTPGVLQHTNAGAGAVSDTLDVTFDLPTTDGSMILVVANCSNSTAITSITDNLGNPYGLAGDTTFSSGEEVVLYYATAIAGGAAHTVSVKAGQPTSSIKVMIVEIQSASSLLGFAEGSGSFNVPVTATLPVAPGQFVYAAMAVTAVTNISPGAGFDFLAQLDHPASNTTMAGEVMLITTAATARGSFSMDATVAPWVTLMAIFSDD